MGCVAGLGFLAQAWFTVYPYSHVQCLYFDSVCEIAGADVDLRRADVNGVFLKHSVAQIGISHCEERR